MRTMLQIAFDIIAVTAIVLNLILAVGAVHSFFM